MTVLRHLAAVREGTVVVLFTEGQPPALKKPREVLLPDRNPFKQRVKAMPISTEPVRLRITATDLLTLDGHAVASAEVTVAVQVTVSRGHGRLLSLAADHGSQLGAYLCEQVRRSVENSIRAGVRMNHLADLQRQGLRTILTDRWLSRTFASDLVVLTDFDVTDVEWSDAESDEPVLAVAELPAEPGQQAKGPLELSVDVRLRRLWLHRLPDGLLGIAGAKVGDRTTVIAVVEQEPPAYESRQLWEDFGAVYQDRDPTLVVTTARSYAELVEAWFGQLGLGPGPAARVAPGSSAEQLVITLPAELADPDAPGSHWQGPDGSQATALRRLLPHQVVEIGYAAR